MASVAIIADGAVLKAVAFIGGNYLARFLSGDYPQASLEQKKDMTKLSRLIKPLMPNMKNKAACLDQNAARKQLQSCAPRRAAHGVQRTKVL